MGFIISQLNFEAKKKIAVTLMSIKCYQMNYTNVQKFGIK